jgi:hypothetical protein
LIVGVMLGIMVKHSNQLVVMASDSSASARASLDSVKLAASGMRMCVVMDRWWSLDWLTVWKI